MRRARDNSKVVLFVAAALATAAGSDSGAVADSQPGLDYIKFKMRPKQGINYIVEVPRSCGFVGSI
jgi:hypothetical protein